MKRVYFSQIMENENISNSRLLQDLTTSGFRGVILYLLMAAESLQQVNASDSFTSTSKNRGVKKKDFSQSSFSLCNEQEFISYLSSNGFLLCPIVQNWIISQGWTTREARKVCIGHFLPVSCEAGSGNLEEGGGIVTEIDNQLHKSHFTN